VWSRHLAVAVVLAVAAVLLLCVWTASELRSKTPLVDVRAVRHPAVAGANIAMFVGGSGMYLLLTLITRYAQTPHSAGYGFGLTTFAAGLVLVPFSVLGFVAGKLTPRVRTLIDAPLLLAGSAVVVGGGFVLFAAARSNLAELLVAMGVLGFGVGSFSAAMPGVILAVTPQSETSSAMSFNYVVRSAGYSLGSAIGGLILATDAGHLFPDDHAYTTAALVGIAAMAVTALAGLALARQHPPGIDPTPRH
jgi:predicted MFS family arabinose efflux permease